MALSAGTKLGRYQIRHQLGVGGMGEVYLAQDTTELERLVAIKVLPTEFASDKARLHRFIQEAKTASSLNHPNILTIYEIGETDSTRFIATEFIEGQTLRQQMKESPVRLDQMIDVAIQIASALSSAHQAKIIHRDVKPENVMIRRDGIVKVLDFGLAKVTNTEGAAGTQGDGVTGRQGDGVARKLGDEAETLVPPSPHHPVEFSAVTLPGTVMGTAIYMSPEQARGRIVDERTDVFSLGVVVYEMVAGHLPFEGSTQYEVLASMLNDKAPLPLSRFVSDVPVELERIVEKALRTDREQRYQTMKDLLIDLRSLKQHLEFTAELDRSAPTRITTPKVATLDAPSPVETLSAPAARETVSSAEYIVREIKLHKAAVLITVAVVVALVAAGYFYFRGKSVVESSEINSIAILPFVNVTANEETQYLSDGLTDSLINSLSLAPKLKVIAHSSVFSYKGKVVDPQLVGRELNVQGVVTGRITQRGDNLAISVELTDARDKRHIWGEQYNRRLNDLLAVQEEISRDISSKLRLKLTGEEQKRTGKHYVENIEAYQLYLKGRYADQQKKEEFDKAIEYFHKAIEKDPNYALAYVGISEAYWRAAGQSLSAREAMPKARDAAIKALQIDETLAEAHTALALVQAFYDYDFAGSEREFKRAVELNPGSAFVHQWYGWFLSVMGRADEALAELRRALELDPLSTVINWEIGLPYYFSRQYDRAIEQFNRAVSTDPQNTFARSFLAGIYSLAGRHEEALKVLDDPDSEDSYLAAMTAHTYARMGRRAEAKKIADRLEKQARQSYVSPFLFGKVYAALGEKERAIEWLEKGYENREESSAWLNSDPDFDPLRSEPRFKELVRRIGLP